MIDIVEWLRDRAFRKSGPTMEAVHTKQQEWVWADEVERLREENEKLRGAFLYEYPVRYIKGDLAIADDTISELETENTKLRNALKECASDLEYEINARYQIDGKVHPALKHKYDRDMAPVRDAAALLESGNE